MGWIAKDLPTLVFMLLPGFVAAGVFHSLTAHPKTSEFERVIQALIFTSILNVFTYFIRALLLLLGRVVRIGTWTTETELAWSLMLAVPLGLSFVYLANKDVFHSRMRTLGITLRTSYPSEWYGTFLREKRWVILNLADGRRLYGWPEEWPDQPDKGHFLLEEPEWLLDNNERAPLYRANKLLIPAGDVKLVEFLKENEEVTQSPAELERVQQLLLDAQKEKDDGSQSTPAGTNPPPSLNTEQKGYNGACTSTTSTSKPLPTPPPPPPKK